MTEYTLDFEIPPDLYRRAVTVPIKPRSSKMKELRNAVAAVLFVAALYALNVALFSGDALYPMLIGGVFGAGLVLVVWWRRHRQLVGHHSSYNKTAGRNRMHLSANKIVATRPGIESHIEWSFVTDIRQVDGATLIELPTARLIVPDAALPEGITPTLFAAQLKNWNGA